jgi:proline iminopeptidase
LPAFLEEHVFAYVRVTTRLSQILLIFCLGLWSPLPAQEPHAVTSHGMEIHYRVFGKGSPLLILGGGPGDSADRYIGLAKLLGRHAQCILVEQRGTGKSTPKVKDASTLNVAFTLDDFEAIRIQLGLKQWSVLGFSYGGYLASLYANAFPDAISSMILLGSMGLNWDGHRVFEDNVASRLCPSDEQSLRYWKDPARLKADPQRAITETIRAKMAGYFFDRAKALQASQEVKPSDFDFEMGEWIYKDTMDRKLDLAKLPVRYQGPVLVLHGRQDPTGESVPQALALHYPHAHLRFLERCGHYSWMEHPERVTPSPTRVGHGASGGLCIRMASRIDGCTSQAWMARARIIGHPWLGASTSTTAAAPTIACSTSSPLEPARTPFRTAIASSFRRGWPASATRGQARSGTGL